MPPTDLVFPRNNEEQLAIMAERLGTRHLIFCYNIKDPLLRERSKEINMLNHDGFTTEFAIVITSQTDITKALSITRSIVSIGKPEFFEDKRITYIIGFETGKRDDFIHHRNSGLNQVLINHATRTGKTLLINAGELLNSQHAQPIIIGRILQNNNFIRKYKPSVMVISGATEPLQLRPPRDLQNLLTLS